MSEIKEEPKPTNYDEVYALLSRLGGVSWYDLTKEQQATVEWMFAHRVDEAGMPA